MGMDLPLFPAWAGVILPAPAAIQQSITIPRMGGGDPEFLGYLLNGTTYSPHGRG